MIRNVIFDIGEVLVRFEETQLAFDLFGIEKGKRILASFWGMGIGNDFDRGVMTDEEIIEKFISFEPELKEEVREYYNCIGECIFHYDYAKAWVKELKDMGYNVYFLSNYNDWFIRSNPDVLDFMSLMDGGVFSHLVHYLKPEREIYECICEKYGLIPSECIFIDDRKENTEGAEAYGIKGYRFLSYENDYENIMRILEENR